MSEKETKSYGEIDAKLEKILSAPALNGGFNKLIGNVDTVLASTEKLKEDVSKIKESIYDPNSGLFSRIKDNENELKRLKEIEQNCPYQKDIKDENERYQNLILRIDRLETFKSIVTSSLYIFVPWTLGITAKIIYDIIIYLLTKSTP